MANMKGLLFRCQNLSFLVIRPNLLFFMALPIILYHWRRFYIVGTLLFISKYRQFDKLALKLHIMYALVINNNTIHSVFDSSISLFDLIDIFWTLRTFSIWPGCLQRLAAQFWENLNFKPWYMILQLLSFSCSRLRIARWTCVGRVDDKLVRDSSIEFRIPL